MTTHGSYNPNWKSPAETYSALHFYKWDLGPWTCKCERLLQCMHVHHLLHWSCERAVLLMTHASICEYTSIWTCVLRPCMSALCRIRVLESSIQWIQSCTCFQSTCCNRWRQKGQQIGTKKGVRIDSLIRGKFDMVLLSSRSSGKEWWSIT